MRDINVIEIAIVVLLTSSCIFAGGVTGYWDFTNSDMSLNGSAIIGQDLEYYDAPNGPTDSNDWISGGVLWTPLVFTNTMGYVMHPGASANGGGAKVNCYTIIMDMLYADVDSLDHDMTIYQTDMTNLSEGKLKIHNSSGTMPGAMGVLGQWVGYFAPNAYSRIVMAIDLTDLRNDGNGNVVPAIDVYVNGNYQGCVYLNDSNYNCGIDGDWALGTSVLLFNDGFGNYCKCGVDAIQIRDYRMSQYGIAALGGYASSGIPTTDVPDPVQPLAGDINHDETVDMKDFALIAKDWLYSIL